MILNKVLSSLLMLAIIGTLQAQDRCGSTYEDNVQIKVQLMENRARISAADLAQVRASRNIKYIPVTFHLIGNGQGQDYPNPMGALFSLCALNRDYAVQDIQFYFNGNQPIRYLANQTVYTDGYSQPSQTIMGNAKVAGSMNIFIGNTVSQPVAGYYSPGRDIIFIRRSEANLGSKTLTHEAGHFYTLPHTFFGWENLNYDDTYNGMRAPVTVNGGRRVEYKARTGANANCDTEADNFCDTEADYYSFRVACNHNTTVLDPDGVRLTPSNRNYMSYFDDSCMDTFTQEQRDAILASLMQRGWLNFATPNLDTVTSSQVAATLPLDSAVVQYNSAGLVNFQWTPQPSAIGYIVSLERTLLGQTVSTVFTQLVYGTAYSTSMANLSMGEYRWSVLPFGRQRACDAQAKSFAFRLSAVPTSVTENTVAEPFLMISPNPVQQGADLQIRVAIEQAMVANLAIYSLDGRAVWQQKQSLSAGENQLILNTADFAAGMYVLQMESAQGRQQSRLIIR